MMTLSPSPMSFTERYNKLNDQQRRAVDTIDGPVMVVAGPGSGKTELLGMRVANILQKTDISPSSILCITFTDAAAANMRQRLIGLIGQTAYDVSIHTFHSLGTEVIQHYSDYFYDGAEVLPADDIMTLEIVTDILKKLPKSSPLASFHEEQGFVHAKKVIGAISDIKRGALTPELFSQITEDTIAFQEETKELLQSIFTDRISKQTLERIPSLVEGLHGAVHGNLRALPTMHTLKERVLMDLKPILEAESTKPLTEWKKQYTEKDEKNQTVWKELKHHKKYRALAQVYGAYQEGLKRRALVDFNDMLMRVVEALKSSPDLRFTLQERYLYILIDEFQDTNGIQLELARLLAQTDEPTYRPNILAVGDDDQAIYKFQGANVDNLLGFKDLFPDPAYIVLDKNYRSTSSVLAAASEVIEASEDRLANLMPETFTKHLTAANESLEGGSLTNHRASSEEEEAAWVAEQIGTLIKSGVDPDEIAVLGRNHAHLKPIADALLARSLPFVYERSNNVLNGQIVMEVIAMLEFVTTLLQPHTEPRDDVLARILEQPCWNLPALTLWRLSRKAFETYKPWIDILLESEEARLRHIALFFLEVAKRAQVEPVESVFDLLAGSHDIYLQDGEESIEFRSPFRAHYFPGAGISEQAIQLLAELRGLLKNIRAYMPREMILPKDFMATLRLYKQYGLSISADEQLLRRQHGLKLMTVHKAKGLEFDHVFIVHCTQDAWVKKRGGNGDIALPKFLGLRAQPETESDFRKLFFVALTRAKRYLYMTYARTDLKGKEMVPLRYLEGETIPTAQDLEVDIATMLPSLELYPETTLTREHKEFLADILAEYSLSATHFNSFLDVTNGGPRQFMIDHVLRFPARKQPSAAFGTAMHCAVERLYRHLREHETLPSAEYLEEEFINALNRERLSKEEREKFIEHGKEQLRVYLHERGHAADPRAVIERNFRNDQVHLGEACITGKIDRMHVDDDTRTIEVCDWKTGRAVRSWTGKQEFEKHKLWCYRNQLMFYKLLVENSPQFRGRYVVSAGCLEFLEHRDGEILTLPLEFSHDEMSRFAQLVQVVFHKIKNQEFIDTSTYSPDMKGTLQFEEDLLTQQQSLL